MRKYMKKNIELLWKKSKKKTCINIVYLLKKYNIREYISALIFELKTKTKNFFEDLKTNKESPLQFFCLLKVYNFFYLNVKQKLSIMELLKDCIDACPVLIGQKLEENKEILKSLGEIAKLKSLNQQPTGFNFEYGKVL